MGTYLSVHIQRSFQGYRTNSHEEHRTLLMSILVAQSVGVIRNLPAGAKEDRKLTKIRRMKRSVKFQAYYNHQPWTVDHAIRHVFLIPVTKSPFPGKRHSLTTKTDQESLFTARFLNCLLFYDHLERPPRVWCIGSCVTAHTKLESIKICSAFCTITGCFIRRALCCQITNKNWQTMHCKK